MTIRGKLALNVGSVILIIAGIVFASTRGMRSVQGNIWALTQKSTPVQVKTIELGKAVQGVVGALNGANAATNAEELKGHRSQVDQALGDVKKHLGDLQALSGGQGGEVLGELSTTSKDLTAVADERLKAQADAEAAARAASEKLKETLAPLKALDDRAGKLQKTAASQFQSAMEEMKKSSASVQDVQILSSSLANLQLIAFQILKEERKLLMASLKGKANAEVERAAQNAYLKTASKVQESFRGLKKKTDELIAAKYAYFAEPGEKTKPAVEAVAAELDGVAANLVITLDAEVSRLNKISDAEQKRQDDAFKTLSSVNAVMGGSRELSSLGKTMEALSARLSAATTVAGVDAAKAESNGALEQAQAAGKRLGATLGQMGAKGDVPLVGRAVEGLRGMRELIAGDGGMAAKLRHSLELNQKAKEMSKRLQETATRQAKRGQDSMAAARGDQEGAIRAVNDSLRHNTTVIVWSGAAAVLFGLGFGFWIYRSISKPLGALSRVAAQVEQTGDFSLRSEARGNDEVALTIKAFNSLLENLHRVIGDVNRVMGDLAQGDLRSTVQVEARGDLDALKQRINTTIASLNQTIAAFRDQAAQSSNASAESAKAVDQVASSSRQQLDAVSRLAAAIQQTGATIADISGNADVASNHSRSSSQLVAVGRQKVEGMAQAMGSIASNSDQISSISRMIIDIADQTSLLALNAAIEAARAGEHGRGFAVVADEVSKLSEKVTTLAKDISSVVGASVKESAAAVKEAQAVRTEMEKISTASVEIDDMLQRIAAAIEEQNATVTSITQDVGVLSEIADENASASEQLAATLAALAEAAEGASRQVARFHT